MGNSPGFLEDFFVSDGQNWGRAEQPNRPPWTGLTARGGGSQGLLVEKNTVVRLGGGQCNLAGSSNAYQRRSEDMGQILPVYVVLCSAV